MLTVVGSGLANVPVMVLVSHWFRKGERGRAAGLMVATNGVAIILAGMLIPALQECVGPSGWRTGWKLMGVFTLFTSLLSAVLLRNSPESVGVAPYGEERDAESLGSLSSLRDHKSVLVHLGVLYFIFGSTYMVYGTFVVTSMVKEWGIKGATAGKFWAWVGFFSVFSGPLFGALSDRIGRGKGLAAVFAVHVISYSHVIVRPGPVRLYLSVFLYGVSAWSVPTIMAAAVGDFLGAELAAAGFSTITLFFAAGQTVGPGIGGFLAEIFGTLGVSYATAAIACAAAVKGALLLGRRENR